MYLQRLVEFAEIHENLFPPLGYKRKRYDWIVDVVDEEFHFIPAERGDTRELPDVTRSSGTVPILLADKADYVFGFVPEGASERVEKRASERHQAYLSLLKKCAESTKDSSITQILSLLKQPISNLPENIKESDFCIFRTNIDEFPHENRKIQSFWQEHLKPKVKKEDSMQCIICGEIGAVMDRHSIVFPLGPERTKLISANATAYESHNLKASKGAPTCYMCEQKYGQALEYLLQRYDNKEQPGGPHMLRLNDLSYVFWLRKKEQMTGLNQLMNIPTSNPNKVRELIESTFSGIKQDREIKDFCVLTLSANKARMVVRGYEENSLEDVQQNIERFFEAQDVGQPNLYGIYTLAGTMYIEPSTQMEKYAITEWIQWLMEGRPLSGRVLIPLLRQIQAGGKMYPQHGAAIKSWLVSQSKEEWEMIEKGSILCGRLFAVLEKLQQDATGSNETIASRFFGSASTAPHSIFGLLIKNSQAHLNAVRKKSKGIEINYSRRIQEILKNLESFPSVLDLKEQAEFALGYYHERQDLYTKRENRKG